MSNNLSKEKRGSIFNTSEFDINELDIYISELKTVIEKGQELVNSLSWIRKLSDHYSDLRTKVQEINELMEGFEKIILEDKIDSEVNNRDNLDSLPWMAISKFNKLSIQELEEFRTKVYWEEISKKEEIYLHIHKTYTYTYILIIYLTSALIHKIYVLKQPRKDKNNKTNYYIHKYTTLNIYKMFCYKSEKLM